MMKYCCLFIFLIMISLNSFCNFNLQDTIFNQTGANGLKQGWWEKYYPNGNLMYRGYFKNDKPAGELQRYFESGNLKALIHFNEKGDYASAKLYYEDGTLASEGFYHNLKKDSVWKYYSYYDHTLKSSETYKDGIKQGLECHYYPNGKYFDKIEWKNNVKDGGWEQFFEDGNFRLRGGYANGKLSGDFYVYYPNNIPMVKGHYTNDMREGKWIYYNQDGTVNNEVLFVSGKAQNEKELSEQQQEYFKKIEQNIGKITEPDANEFFQRNRDNDYDY